MHMKTYKYVVVLDYKRAFTERLHKNATTNPLRRLVVKEKSNMTPHHCVICTSQHYASKQARSIT